MPISTTNKKMFSLRDVIWFCSLVVTFSASYFPMKAQVKRNSDTLNKYNLELIVYKQNEIKEKVDNFSTDFDDFIKSWDNYNSK